MKQSENVAIQQVVCPLAKCRRPIDVVDTKSFVDGTLYAKLASLISQNTGRGAAAGDAVAAAKQMDAKHPKLAVQQNTPEANLSYLVQQHIVHKLPTAVTSPALHDSPK